MGRFGMQSQSKGGHCPEDGVDIRAALTRQGLVQAFAREPGISSDLAHTLRSCEVAKRSCDECRVAVTTAASPHREHPREDTISGLAA